VRWHWIDDGEKCAVVGLSVKVEGQLVTGQVAPYLWAVADMKFGISPHCGGGRPDRRNQ
jgi:hypothetical protein